MNNKKLLSSLVVLFLLAGCNAKHVSESEKKSEQPSNSDSASEVISSSDITEEPSEIISSEDSSISFEESEESSISFEESEESSISSEESEESSISSEETVDEFENFNGRFTFNEEDVVANVANSIAINTTDTFEEGTLSASVTPNSQADNGIIFKVSFPSGASTFWEGNNIGYYFFFVSQAGTAYLGKTNNGSWTVCKETPIQAFNKNNTYKLAVSVDSSNDLYDSITCFVNGQEVFSYADDNKLTGNMYGFRAGGANAKFSYFEKSDEKYLVQAEKLNGYYIANGRYAYDEDTSSFRSTVVNSIAFDSVNELGLGSMEATMKTSAVAADNGIIFGLTPSNSKLFWEAGVSYYFYFISKDGCAFLGKVSNGAWSNCAISSLLPNYKAGDTYKLKIERVGTTILCYVNDELYLTYDDIAALDGKGFGIRAGAEGVSFSDIKTTDTGGSIYHEPTNYDIKSGNFVALGDTTIRASQAGALALNNKETLDNGTISFSMINTGSLPSGLIFKSNDDATSYYYFYFKGHNIYLDKVVNGKSTNLGYCFVTAGYSSGANYPYKVTYNNGDIKCFYTNKLYITFKDEEPLTGNRYGFASTEANNLFGGITTSTDTTFNEVETLVFGHSYMELWSNYKEDLSKYSDIYNIGIGGSIASQWKYLEDEIVAYNPKRGIYDIGINDLTGGVSPVSVVSDVEELLVNLKTRMPEFEVALISTNRCTARENITSQIAELNDLYKQLAGKYDWIYYANVDEAFLDVNGYPIASCFTDGLHPSASSYKIIAQAVYDAFDGIDQPEITPEEEAEIIAQKKAILMSSIDIYSEYAYDLNTYEEAKTTYEAALQAIDNCTTKEELDNLDLSTYIATLKTFDNFADDYMDSIVKTPNRVSMNTGASWAYDDNGYVVMSGIGLSMDKTYKLTDYDFTFELQQIQGEVGYGGIIIRANQNSYAGIDGYLINYVTSENYIQVYYLQNQYTSNSTIPQVLEYIGGWVFPAEVENTVFRATVEGNYLYINTQEDYAKRGKESGLKIDLSYNGKYEVYQEGYTAFISFVGDSESFKLKIHDVVSEEINQVLKEKAEEEEEPEGESVHEEAFSSIIDEPVQSSWDLVKEHTALWTYDETTNSITTPLNSVGWQLGNDFYQDLEMTVKMSGIATANPYGGGPVTKAFLVGADTNGDYPKGYAISVYSNGTGDNWIQVQYLDGTGIAGQFVGGFAGLFDDVEFTVKIKDKRLSIWTGGYQLTIIDTYFNNVDSILLPNYDGGYVGIFNWEGTIASTFTMSKLVASEVKTYTNIASDIMSTMQLSDAPKSSWELVNQHAESWEYDETTNSIITKGGDDGWALSVDSYTNFEMVFKIDGVTAVNPYGGNNNAKTFIIGAEANGNYPSGFAITLFSDGSTNHWFQVACLNNGSLGGAFLGGSCETEFNNLEIKVTVVNQRLYLSYRNGNEFQMFNSALNATIGYVDLAGYEGGHVGIINWDNVGSTFTLLEFKVLD